MTTQVRLALAAFLDSPAARALPDPEAARDLAEAFFRCAYEDLGKAPHLLEEHDLEQLLREGLPARLRRADPRAAQARDVLDAVLNHLEESAVVTHLWELRRALDEHAATFEATVAAGTFAGQRAPRQRTVSHQAAKTGRNDPCWCGSGKKFKKCCGKTA